MVKMGIVGCTGKLGNIIMSTIMKNAEAELKYAIGRPGNQYIGHDISSVIGGQPRNIFVTNSVLGAIDCDVLIDCTNAEGFMNNLIQYETIKKPLVIGTTGLSEADELKIKKLAGLIPIFKTGNFSLTLYNFVETLKFAAKTISVDTDVQIIEFHHKQKKDAPSGTALMIQDALIGANHRLTKEKINICSVRGGNMFGEHHVIFANYQDEVTEYIHKVSSREAFSHGAVEAAKWIVNQQNGLYSMNDLIKNMRIE